ncbi:MAG: 3-ketoacyl-ACP reductase [Synergistaceae bacterium]|jgi:NAD(P)-dependent dehydrogenase (short-subunit alcohol dehydrogenase family)|nr:3-ketoacyl-ACP reductase [Synergistaceae bacterium]
MRQKTVFVTGSSRGIGYGILKKFAENGYRTVMSGVSGEERAAEKLRVLRDAGFEVSYIRCDIANASDRAAALDEISKKYAPLDALVNNAGVAPLHRLNVLETTEESFGRVLGTNLKGTFFMTQLFANAMIEWKKREKPEKAFPDGYSPRIVNISSVSADVSSTNRGEYCISKAGVSMVTLLFADALASHGIPVFEVRPGIVRTDMTEAVKEKYDKFISEGGLPLRRWGTPEDVGEAVFALTSGAFDYSTGQVVNVDGGFHVRRL